MFKALGTYVSGAGRSIPKDRSNPLPNRINVLRNIGSMVITLRRFEARQMWEYRGRTGASKIGLFWSEVPGISFAVPDDDAQIIMAGER